MANCRIAGQPRNADKYSCSVLLLCYTMCTDVQIRPRCRSRMTETAEIVGCVESKWVPCDVSEKGPARRTGSGIFGLTCGRDVITKVSHVAIMVRRREPRGRLASQTSDRVGSTACQVCFSVYSFESLLTTVLVRGPRHRMMQVGLGCFLDSCLFIVTFLPSMM